MILENVRADTIWLMDSQEIQRYAVTRNSRHVSRQVVAPVLQDHAGGVVVLDIAGILMHQAIFSDEISMPHLGDQFISLAENDSVSAVVMNIDSPGGVALGMTRLTEAAKLLADAKPLFVHAEYLMASGAYWLASLAHKIFTGPDADIGSVGVRNHIWDWSKYFDEFGVRVVAVDTGPFKSLGLPGIEVTEEHKQFLQDRVDAVMVDFMAAVAEGRTLTDSQIEAVKTAKVFQAKEALEVGLIDGMQTLAETITVAMAAAESSSPETRTKIMAETKNEPKAATLAELKKAMPESTAEFREEQQEANATLSEALAAHGTLLAAENKRLVDEKAEADKQAAEDKEKAEKAAAASSTDPPKKRGNSAVGKTTPGEGEGSDSVDYRQMAEELMTKKNISWQEACRQIKKRHPDALEAFIAAGSAK